MTISEWLTEYKKSHPDTRLSDRWEALKASGDLEACHKASAERAAGTAERSANDIIHDGLSALNKCFARMIT